MLAHVDESGCTGMKFDSGSSRFFAVTAVLFGDDAHALECAAKIEALRLELKVAREFHFSKCNHENKNRFFAEIQSFDFNYFGLVIDKASFCSVGLRFDDAFLERTFQGLFIAAAQKLENATVVFDRTGSSVFRKSLSKTLRKDVNEQLEKIAIKTVRHSDSHRESLLQLADMTCGAVARSFYTEKHNPACYRDKIRSKEWFVFRYPGA